MALKLNTTLEGGVIAPDCYAKIIRTEYLTRIGISGATPGIRLFVGFYFNEDARDADDQQFVEQREYLLEDMTKETRADQYTYLKTLDDFTGAIDA